MKILSLAFLLLAPGALMAQRVDIAALQARCLPEAPGSTLQAIIRVESSGNPNAMQIDFPRTMLKRWGLPEGTIRLKRQPQDAAEALQWAQYFAGYGVDVDLGLMQVSTAEARRRGLSPRSLLEPCANMRAGWQILEGDYRLEAKRYGEGQIALQHAISRYNTGDTQRGIDNGYFGRVMAALDKKGTKSCR